MRQLLFLHHLGLLRVNSVEKLGTEKGRDTLPGERITRRNYESENKKRGANCSPFQRVHPL